ncbi:MAG: MerR family transcriptional regulator [Planctomycetota bacterium]|nr:MerR family transcriptional regulator [Planctomycetota bacterium]
MPSSILSDKRVCFVGRLASMSKRDAARLARDHGATVAEKPSTKADLIVVGEESLPLVEDALLDELLDRETRQAFESGALEVIVETELWRRLDLVEIEADIHRLYTPAMLAELLGVPVAVIRRWHRRGLIVPTREVRRLPYFDFQEVATARRLAELLAAGDSPAAIERKLESLARYLPSVRRPLAQLSVIVEGRQILLRQGDGLIEPGGQLRFDFDAPPTLEITSPEQTPVEQTPVEQMSLVQPPAAEVSNAELARMARSPDDLFAVAAELEEEGDVASAIDAYRAAMAATGPTAEACFQLAELFYRLDDVSAARERYYMAIELDEDYVEARANLGCVLAETGQLDLAVAAFEGALAFHGDYADVHYHLARALSELGDRKKAHGHWQSFVRLAPDSPWAEEARKQLGEQ